MASDYQSIHADNRLKYGTDIGRIGPMLLSDRYDDRTHFIFELLQNAEDALARRSGWQGARCVSFHLMNAALRVSHFGRPFDEPNVRGICGIAESTKDLTDIGRFGIGFKSVYAFTDRPEIHSGAEDFAIESFVWPVATTPLVRDPDETVILIPLKASDETGNGEIATGLGRLGVSTLLFLREIEEIRWSVEGGPSGIYMRSQPEPLGKNVRRITVIGQQQNKPVTEATWLVFSRPVLAESGVAAGHVEIAFLTSKDDSGAESVRPVGNSPLVAFFPTVLETHLGFLVQGPYRTTPSRDNVPRHDEWNQHCVRETATVLVDALRWLRDHDLLGVGALGCLPLDRAKFGEDTRFAPLFDAVRQALSSESLLPRFGGGHASAKKVKLARTQELRVLLPPSQLSELFGMSGETFWLSEDITQDRVPDLRQYLIHELGITEETPETILPRLNKLFLEKQSDDWILRLYEFLHGQPALLRQGRLNGIPIVRLEDGNHVTAEKNNRRQAFLPSAIKTDFPTVRRSVCGSKTALAFLVALGLSEPDPVDDVIWNLLPKYAAKDKDLSTYQADVQRILTAFATDSKIQREKLLDALRKTPFVRAVDAGDDSKWIAVPEQVYLATERLKNLFKGVPKVLLVDETYTCLRGEAIRDLLEACGATRYLRPVRIPPRFTWQELQEMRGGMGSGGGDVEDFTLSGLTQLLASLASLSPDEAGNKATILWEALCDVEDRRGAAFVGTYRWFYRTQRSCAFDAAFLQQLKEASWVPDRNGVLQQPEFVVFEGTGWKINPFLLSKIRFKPAIIETLAKEAGIEPGVLDLLKKLGVTSEAELRNRLGLKDEPTEGGAGPQDNVEDALKKLLGDAPAPTPPVPDPASTEPSGSGSHGSGNGAGTGVHHATGSNPGGGAGAGGKSAGEVTGSEVGAGKRTPGSAGGRPFISYVGTHHEEESPDPDGLDQAARMALEAQAIDLIVSREPEWQRTPTGTKGYDLYQAGEDGEAKRWCEVKAMTGSLHDRPVGLSRMQFKHAQEQGEAYWLYVVEHAGSEKARIVRIQDPVGKARTFTFDHGWLSIARIPNEERIDTDGENRDHEN